MKTFTNVAAQGEITIRRLAAPEDRSGYTALPIEQGHLIVGHSETGHHHVLDPRHASVMVLDRPPTGMRVLLAIVDSPTPIVHLRGHDTHEPIMLAPGEYEIRIGREYDPYSQISRQQMD